MRGVMLYGEGDVRFEERAAPTIGKPTDAIVRVAATCVCGTGYSSLRRDNRTGALESATSRRRAGYASHVPIGTKCPPICCDHAGVANRRCRSSAPRSSHTRCRDTFPHASARTYSSNLES